MESLPSLTRDEAEARAALLSVESYEIAVDLTDLLTGEDFKATSTIRFSCRTPGAGTFVDAAVDVVSAELNGVEIPREMIATGRIQLDGLEADNTLVVSTVQHETSTGEYVHRTVDPSDGEVYVWTSFEPDDARRAWACFDQPDLKAPHQITVTAPAAWTVVSNSGDPVIDEAGAARTWVFPPTPPLSTYLPVVTAGPFHEIRSERGKHDLGLFARKSLGQFLERDAEELFEVTDQGLRFYGERFGLEFPQRKYDQVFCPDLGGAMENYGCVAWTDAVIYRQEPTYAERELRAKILLHEMAHMWFGDMVTMQWWEDLWLNEAFAEWACHYAAVSATRFTDAWAGFLTGEKLWGYASDMAPTTHPIRQPVNDVAEAAASFDGITYPKGASVLKQLFALVGEEACVDGLRGYFARYAWGNTRLEDLMAELSRASGRDLTEWTRGWLDTSGTDRLTLTTDSDGSGVLRATGPGGTPPRTHRLDLGVYDRAGDALTRRDLVSIETEGSETSVSGLGAAALVLVNDEDLTFASVRPDDSSLQVMLSSVAELPTAISRAVAVTTAWDMVLGGDLAARDFVRCVTTALPREDVDSVVEPYLDRVSEAASMWSPDSERGELMAHVADMCIELLDSPTRRQVALRTLAATATTDEQLARLRAEIGDDVDLGWRTLVRLAELGDADADEVAALSERDPDPDSWVRALAVDSARPDPAHKQATWDAIVDRKVPMGSLYEVSRAFWRRSQVELLAPYADRYLEMLPTLHTAGMIPAMGLTQALFPRTTSDPAFPDRATAAARVEGVAPAVAKGVLERVDMLQRMLRSRGR